MMFILGAGVWNLQHAPLQKAQYLLHPAVLRVRYHMFVNKVRLLREQNHPPRPVVAI
jgi:hypothetical protein